MVGYSRVRLAKESGSSTNQMGIFLRGSGFLNQSSLEKSLQILGVNFDVYLKRYELAKKIAGLFSSQGVSNKRVVDMNRAEMISLSGLPEVGCLMDVNEEEFELMVKSGVADYEATYPYFKTMVIHLMQVGDEKWTTKNVETSFGNTAEILGFGAAFAFLPISSIVGFVTAMLFAKDSYKSVAKNAFSPFIAFTKKLLSDDD